MAKQTQGGRKTPPKQEVVKKPTLNIEKAPEVEVKKPKPAEPKKPARYFIVEFIIRFTDKKTKSPQIKYETVSLGGIESYPNRKQLLSELPLAYGIHEDAGYEDILVFNVRITELSKEDYADYLKE